MKKFVLWLTLTALLAAVSPAAGQIVKPWEKKTWDAKKRDFILATLEDSELSALRKPSERQREEYRRERIAEQNGCAAQNSDGCYGVCKVHSVETTAICAHFFSSSSYSSASK